jgi:molecular chaperone DnaK (HSP70)
MPVRLGVDFGTSNTVIALWDDGRGEAAPISVPRHSQAVAVGKAGRVPVVPSLIYYAPGGRPWVGAQVHSNQVYESPQAFRWMKRGIMHRSGEKQQVAEREVSPAEAAGDFLTAVLAAAGEGRDWADAELAFTVPIDSFEDYREWLGGVAEKAGFVPPRFIDAASAAALGYGMAMQDGEVYFVFDFGGGSLGISILLVEAPEPEAGEAPSRRCHVLGKSSADLGGAMIDQWLFEDVLARNGHAQDSEEARLLGRALLVDCERCKEQLSKSEKADVSVLNAETGVILSADYTREQFEQLLESHGLYARIDQAIGLALDEARTHGCEPEHVTAALMVGGSSLVRSVGDRLVALFGEDRVRLDRPLDAPARGAAAFAAGAEVVDFLQHDYAIRHIDPATGGHAYRAIVRRGTVYPTAEPVAKVLVKASHENQNPLGIALFEVEASAGVEPQPEINGTPMELSFDVAGAVKLNPVSSEDRASQSHFWLNEHRPTFLSAEPPTSPGEARFEVHFDIDADRRLLITAQDLKTGETVLEGQAVVKLT